VLAHDERHIATTLRLGLSDPGNFDLNDGRRNLAGELLQRSAELRQHIDRNA
jgi:hypothetical protein